MTLAIVGVIFLVTVICADVGFVIHYTILTDWWKGPVGQSLVALAGCLALLYTWSLIVIFWPHIPYRAEIRVGLFGLLTVVTVWRYFTLVKLAKTIRAIRDELDQAHEHIQKLNQEDE